MPFHKSAGYSLLEIIVVISIMVLITGGGVAGFLTFRDNQESVQIAKDIQSVLRDAQTKARTGEVPGGGNCSELIAYGVWANRSIASISCPSGSVCLMAKCKDNSGSFVFEPVDEHELSALASFTVNQFALFFPVLHGGVTQPDGDPITSNDGIITVTIGQPKYQFEVTSGGQISEGERL